MDALTLDQIQIFLTVADTGSFSKAAQKLGRAQSAVTYGIQKLEELSGVVLFDRSTYRPGLTEAGRALLGRARRVADATDAFRETARSLANGLEPELTIAVDSMFPMQMVFEALREFTTSFPTVPPRLFVRPLGEAVELLLNDSCMIGLLPLQVSDSAELRNFPLLTIGLVPVAAPGHPLSAIAAPIEADILNRFVQIVLTGRSASTDGRDYGVLSAQTWRVADLGAKHSMLRAGLGWGNMPAHLVDEDIALGRLKIINPADFDRRTAQMVMGGAYRKDRQFGPAGRWFINHLSESELAPGTPPLGL